jgi:glycosyltransferase involved in cell wall biosynthesis
MSNPIQVSIIIATYNWHNALDIILDNLSRQVKKRNDIEIIIADDGSTPETREVIKRHQLKFSHIIHVWHEDDGFRKAKILNQAVAGARGEYLIFLDGDCIPFPDFIAEHLRIKEAGYMIAGNRILLSPKFSQQILANPQIVNNIVKWRLFNWLFAKLTKSVNKLLPALRLGNGKWRYRRSNNWKYPKGCNFAVARADFMQVNGFDESFSGWGHEDADLFVRLLHSGVGIKDGRFAIPVLHLWHNQESRATEKDNYQRLLNRVADVTCIKADLGVEQYLVTD